MVRLHSAILPGNANVAIGRCYGANRENDVPGGILRFCSRHTRPDARAYISGAHGTMNPE